MGYTARFDTMDKRLNQIQTGTLTESRMNEDFVFWMKTTGLNILLVILLIGCGYMGWHWWQRTRNQARADAWQQLERAGTPEELAVVASEQSGVDAIAVIAKLRAANTYLDSILSGQRFDRDAGAEDAKITAELRREWLDNADQLFLEVSETLAAPGTATALQPSAFHALIGRATIAESRGDAAAAKRFLDEADARFATSFPALATVARKRGESVEVAAMGIELPPRASLPTGAASPLMPDASQAFPNIPGLRISPTDPSLTLSSDKGDVTVPVNPATSGTGTTPPPAPTPAPPPTPAPAPAPAPAPGP